jgi:Fungal specific transcription factor domain
MSPLEIPQYCEARGHAGNFDLVDDQDSNSADQSSLSLSYVAHNFSSPSLDSFTTPPDFDREIIIPGPLGSPKAHSYSRRTLRDRIPTTVLLPFVELFFDHLFPIMPVLDREYYFSLDVLLGGTALPLEEYTLLTAMAAVTIVQLNLSADQVEQNMPGLSAEVLVEESIYERHMSDYIETPGTSVVLTSFFLFGYHGNLEKHNKARYFLHEAISFAESIRLDDETYLSQLEPRQAQICRRIFWLLFITER